MEWWSEFWTWVNENELAATVIGGLIVAVILGTLALIPKLRKPLLGALRRLLPWIGGLRLTTKNQRARAIEDALAARWFDHFIRPQFVVAPTTKDDYWEWILYNTAEHSIAEHDQIRVSEPFFHISSAADWERIKGPGVVKFRGVPTRAGRQLGVDFHISWIDVSGEANSSTFSWSAPTFA